MPPGVGFSLVFIGLGVGVLNSFFALEVGNLPIKKIAGGGGGGGGEMVRLGID